MLSEKIFHLFPFYFSSFLFSSFSPAVATGKRKKKYETKRKGKEKTKYIRVRIARDHLNRSTVHINRSHSRKFLACEYARRRFYR